MIFVCILTVPDDLVMKRKRHLSGSHLCYAYDVVIVVERGISTLGDAC